MNLSLELQTLISKELKQLQPNGKILRCFKMSKEDLARILQTSKPPEGYRYARTYYGDYMYITLVKLLSDAAVDNVAN